MASFIRARGRELIGVTSCCDAPTKPSQDKTHLVCRGCEEEVVPLQIGVTMEQALLEHARKTNTAAKRTTVSAIRHNTVQLMQEFGEHTMAFATDQWELWQLGNKRTIEQNNQMDHLAMGIINVFVMKWTLRKHMDSITVTDVAEAMYQDPKYLRRLCEERLVPLAIKLNIPTKELINETLKVCVHEPLREVLNGFQDTEVDSSRIKQ
jgi:hypothetical protein